MEINFNSGKKIAKETTKVDEEKEVEEESFQQDFDEDFESEEESKPSKKSSSNNDDMKKKMLKMMLVVFVIFVLFILVMYLMSVLNKKVYTYTEVEQVMKKAGENYFKNHTEYLPKDEGDTVQVDVKNLVNEGYMKDLYEYLGEETSCVGSVTCEKITSTGYSYSPYLNCGDAYETIELYKKITTDGTTVTTGDGLYSENGEYVFKGENVNNYVKLSNATWRIVKVNKDNTITLILSDRVKNTTLQWDDRYNTEKSYNIGINKYEKSRIKDYLETVYKGKDAQEAVILSGADRAFLTSFDLCIGNRSQKETTKNNSIECSRKITGQTIGLLTASDFINASLDAKCVNTISESCQNYNYLSDFEYDWWLATADDANTYDVYNVNEHGGIEAKHSSSGASLRPVIQLKNSAYYSSGNGTSKKPYRVK